MGSPDHNEQGEMLHHGVSGSLCQGQLGPQAGCNDQRGLYSPLQFLAILNMFAALVYISQASSTRVLPLEQSKSPSLRAGVKHGTETGPQVQIGLAGVTWPTGH